MNLDEYKALLLRWKRAYYNDEEEVEDHVYDALENKIRKADPDWVELAKTGVRVMDEKIEVLLPQLMPSLDKIYPDAVEKTFTKNKTQRWLELLKYDGTALLLRYAGGKPIFLGTRGDGERGGDVRFLIPYLSIPQKIRTTDTVDLRVEGLLKIQDFNDNFSIQARGEKKGKKNPRNTVNGFFNRNAEKAEKTAEDFKHVNLKILGVYGKPMEEGLEWARFNGFDVAEYRAVMRTSILRDFALPSRNLNERLANSEYEMDGLVYVPADRPFEYDNSDKPKWTFAFKENTADEDAPQARVLDVIYEEAKSKKLTPVAIIEPTEIGGVTVTQVTMHNASLMEERQVGPGAVIKVIRSGDVIPFYVSTVEPAPLKWPSVPYRREGCWLYATEFSAAAEHQKILHFFVTCGIEDIAIKSIEALYEAGFTSFMAYFAAAEATYRTELNRAGWVAEEIGKSGIGPAKTRTLVKELKKLMTVDIKTLMLATACMPAGLGDRKLTDIQEHYTLHSMLACKNSVVKDRLLNNVPGFAETSASKFVEGLENFRPIYDQVAEYVTIVPDTKIVKEASVEGRFSGMSAYWTGYRNPAQEEVWVDNGGEIASSFGSKTTFLFWKPGGKKSTKIEKAGARAKIWEDFVKGV